MNIQLYSAFLYTDRAMFNINSLLSGFSILKESILQKQKFEDAALAFPSTGQH